MICTAAICGATMLLLVGCARFGNSELEFTPSVFSGCGEPDVVVDVAWDATPSTQGPISLLVYKPGQRPKMWLEGPPKGQRHTGRWMGDGSTIDLLDANGRLLARRTMEMVPCPAATGQ